MRVRMCMSMYKLCVRVCVNISVSACVLVSAVLFHRLHLQICCDSELYSSEIMCV